MLQPSPGFGRRRGVRRALAAWAVLGVLAAPSARERLDLRRVTLDLPGAPARVIPADLDRDGDLDLLVVVAYTEIQEIGEERIENLVQITTVIPAVFDRREVRAYLAQDDGTYRAAGAPLRLPQSVLHMEPGPAGARIVALTDEGLSRLRFDPHRVPPALRLERLIDEPPVLAGAGSFHASLTLVHDLNGDGTRDVLLPAPDGLSVYLGTSTGLAVEPADRVPLPAGDDGSAGRATRRYPMPEVRDLDGDGIADLLFSGGGMWWDGEERHDLWLGSATGRFRPLRPAARDCHDRKTDLRLAVDDPEAYPWPRELAALRDLDGDGRAEAVFTEMRSRGDSWRKEMKDAKRPIYRYRFHRLDQAMEILRDPYCETKVLGHALAFDAGGEEFGEMAWPAFRQFVDLDGDGREDLITVTLDFSIWQAVKILTTKRLGIGFDFHVYAQQPDGSFDAVPDLDLSEKLKLDLDSLELGRLAQFAGDFDGDGRQDFVHLGRGKTVTIHAGLPGCRYPKKPDLSIVLDEEPQSLSFVAIEDLDGDGRADLRVTRPLPVTDPDVTAPVRLELYLSGGMR